MRLALDSSIAGDAGRVQFHGARIIRIVGHQAKPPPRLEQARDLDQKVVVNHPTVLVPPLGPGVRKEHVHAISARVRQTVQHLAGFAMENFGVVQSLQLVIFFLALKTRSRCRSTPRKFAKGKRRAISTRNLPL